MPDDKNKTLKFKLLYMALLYNELVIKFIQIIFFLNYEIKYERFGLSQQEYRLI